MAMAEAGEQQRSRSGRTRDGTLHDAIRDEGFVLPDELKRRSTGWIVAYASLPFAYTFGAAALGRSALPWWAQTLLAFPLVLAAQRTFLTLVHEASHKFYAAERATNDVLADFLAAGFIGMLVRKYRKIHLAHHSANGSADDPEFFGYEAVRRAGGWVLFIGRYVVGLELPSLLGKYHTKQDEFLGDARIKAASVDQPRRLEKLSIVACQLFLVALFLLAARAPHLYALWLYVAVTWSPLLSRLRFLAEHPGRGELTLSTRGTLLERIFVGPLNFNRHFEHHGWPAVPPYRLQAVHAALVESGFFSRRGQFLADSYVATLSGYGSKWE
jgi:fatty acid desaturase